MRVLVIEDSKTQAQRLALLLTHSGFEVEVAMDGEAGLAACRAVRPDIIVSDVLMPGIDGFEVCRRLKSDPATHRIPIVLLTSLANPLDVVHGLAAGADNFIPKPYEDEQLIARVRRLTASGRASDDTAIVEVAGQRLEVTAGRGAILEALVSSLEAAMARNAELERQYEETQRAVRGRDEVLAIVSHDLRNPLASLLMAVDMAERIPLNSDGAALLHKFKVIRRAGERMNRLIGDLLDVTKIEAGHLTVERVSLDVGALLTEMLAAQRPLAEAKSLHLAIEVAPGLPNVLGDRDRLLQVFGNLVSNAIKFTEAGGSITVRAELWPDAVRFAVQDTGPGLSAEALPRVFDRFWQAERTARQGTGLGLPIVKGLVEAHHGVISVDSHEGVGTTFFFTVPAAAALPV